MERPLVTAIAQIGVIVDDVELAVDRYRDLLGLDEWYFASVPASTKSGRADEGDSVLARIAWTTIGDIEVELIEPRTGTGIYAEFLRTRGPGLHHVMFVTPDYERFADHMGEQGNAVLRSGVLQHTRFQLFDTETDLGLIVEIAEGGPLEPDAPD